MTHTTKWFLSFVAVVVSSCSNNQQPTATAVGTANIHGRVELTDTSYVRPFSGVTVLVEGTNISTTSDDSGNFTLQNVPTGVYNIHYSKPGYGDNRLMSQTVTGGGFADSYLSNLAVLQKVSNFVMTLRSLRFVDTTIGGQQGKYLLVKGDYTSDPAIPQRFDAVMMFLSHTSDVSPTHYRIAYGLTTQLNPEPFDSSSHTFTYPLSFISAADNGFNSGDSIYVGMYGAWPNLLGSAYWDPALNLNIYNSINPTPSAVIGAKVP